MDVSFQNRHQPGVTPRVNICAMIVSAVILVFICGCRPEPKYPLPEAKTSKAERPSTPPAREAAIVTKVNN